MMRPPRLQARRSAVGRGHSRRAVAATGASTTRRDSAERSAAGLGPGATSAAGSRGRAAGGEAPLGLEDAQAAPLLGWPQAVLSRRHGDGPSAPARQQGEGPPRERDMARPPRPAAPLVVLPADCPLGGFAAALAGPARARHAHDCFPRGVVRGTDSRGRQRGGGADASPDQPPPVPPGRQGFRQGPPAPVLPAGPCGPVTGAEAGPALLRQRRQARFARPLVPIPPDVCLAQHRQPRGLGLGFQPPPPPALMAVPTGPGVPLRRHAGRARTGPQLVGPRRLGGQAPVLGNARLPAALALIRPLQGHIEVAIQHGLPQPTGIAHKHADLTGLHLADCATLWAGTAGRRAAFFHQPGLVDAPHGVRGPKVLDNVGVQLVMHGRRLSVGPPQPGLAAIGRRLPTDFRPGPAVCALHRPEPVAPRGDRPFLRVHTRNIRRQPALDLMHIPDPPGTVATS
jgi:hypothetical protein